MKIFLILVLVLLQNSIYANEKKFIEKSRISNNCNYDDLIKRVSDLERTVFLLQQKAQSDSAGPNSLPTWICKVSGKGITFTGIGLSKAIAENEASEKCRNSKETDNGWLCSRFPDCEKTN